jgi:hypothetical protein
MFSATFPKTARRLAKEYMADDCVRIKVGRVGSTHGNIKQQIIYTEESAKSQALFDLIFSEVSPKPDVRISSATDTDFVHQSTGPPAYPGIYQLQSQMRHGRRLPVQQGLACHFHSLVRNFPIRTAYETYADFI